MSKIVGEIDIQKVEHKSEPLWWHKKGLQYTRSGYGGKIPTQWMIKHEGKWRRVYVAIYGNSGTSYILSGKNKDWIVVLGEPNRSNPASSTASNSASSPVRRNPDLTKRASRQQVLADHKAELAAIDAGQWPRDIDDYMRWGSNKAFRDMQERRAYVRAILAREVGYLEGIPRRVVKGELPGWERNPEEPQLRRYQVWAVTKDKEVCMSRPNEPMTHQEAVTFKSKMMQRPGRRLELREVQPTKGKTNPSRALRHNPDYPYVVEYGQVEKNGWPRSKVNVLATCDTKTTHGLPTTRKLVHRTEGYSVAGSAMRFDKEAWGSLFDQNGTTGGKWFKTEAEARKDFDAWCGANKANPSSGFKQRTRDTRDYRQPEKVVFGLYGDWVGHMPVSYASAGQKHAYGMNEAAHERRAMKLIRSSPANRHFGDDVAHRKHLQYAKENRPALPNPAHGEVHLRRNPVGGKGAASLRRDYYVIESIVNVGFGTTDRALFRGTKGECKEWVRSKGFRWDSHAGAWLGNGAYHYVERSKKVLQTPRENPSTTTTALVGAGALVLAGGLAWYLTREKK